MRSERAGERHCVLLDAASSQYFFFFSEKRKASWRRGNFSHGFSTYLSPAGPKSRSYLSCQDWSETFTGLFSKYLLMLTLHEAIL